jgi:hypothetical protein
MRALRVRREVPFSAEAVDGWRAWSVIERDGDVWLASLTRPEEWQPGAPFVASCSRRRHDPPRRACSCGVYAAAAPEELAGLGRIAGAAIGQVSLWGRIAEHSRGYRAGTAYPARLRLVCVPCLGEGDGVPATRVDRETTSGRTRLVPMCDLHADGRPLLSAADVEGRLLARYRVEPVPDASVARIRRDPRIEDAERRSRRRVLAVVAATLSVLAAAALVGEVARDRTTPPIARTVPYIDGSGEGDVVQPASQVLRYAPRHSVSGTCGRVAGALVIATACDDPRAEVVMDNVSSVGSRGGTVCGDETTVVTRLGDRVTCWRPVSAAV